MKISTYINGQWYSIRCNVEDTHFLNRVLSVAIESGKLNKDDTEKADIVRRFLPIPTNPSRFVDTDGVENIGYGKVITHLNYKDAKVGKLYAFSDDFQIICDYPEECERDTLEEIEVHDGELVSFVDTNSVCHSFCREVERTRRKMKGVLGQTSDGRHTEDRT